MESCFGLGRWYGESMPMDWHSSSHAASTIRSSAVASRHRGPDWLKIVPEGAAGGEPHPVLAVNGTHWPHHPASPQGEQGPLQEVPLGVLPHDLRRDQLAED